MSSEDMDWERLDWKRELKNNVVSVGQLRKYVDVGDEEEQKLLEISSIHPINIPRYYLSLIRADDPHDPVRKMCFPSVDEFVIDGSMGETTSDPYGDDKHDKENGVLHKYDYTALLVANEYCAMYCRHCFRRRSVGRPKDQDGRRFDGAVKYILEHPEITNVIISGGDPLMLPNSVLRRLLMSLADIDHLDFVRIGTRAPVTYPIRLFDDELIELLQEFNGKKALYVPTHFNHVNEITATSAKAVDRLRRIGVTVNNQAVLLRGVNDTPEDIISLMRGLLRIGVSPYYLYQCMPVSRVRHHFQIPLKRGVEIVDRARQELDGYGKRFKFIIGHDIGKLEICGMIDNKIVLKQLHARSGHGEQSSRIIMQELDDNAGWVDL